MKVNVRLDNPLLKTDDALFSRCVRLVAESAVLSNRALLREAKRKGKPIPPLFKSGVRYENEPPGMVDECLDIPKILRQGHGDCLHLSAWRVAELREQGEKRARIRVTFKKSRLNPKKRIFHVLVRRGSGLIEDPSEILGMGKE